MFDKIILINYWKTLKNCNHEKTKCIYIKKPYIEEYIFDALLIDNDTDLNNYLLMKINEDEIKLEDISLFLSTILELNTEDKRSVNKRIFEIDIVNVEIKDESFYLIKLILIAVISYTKFYYTSCQLLFPEESEEDDLINTISTLYKSIYIFIELNDVEIKKRYDEDLKLEIFTHILNEFIKDYQTLLEYLEEQKLIMLESYDFKSILIKILFKNWYDIYKKIGKPNTDCKKTSSKNEKRSKLSLLKKILCLPNY